MAESYAKLNVKDRHVCFFQSGTIPGWKTRVGQTVSTDTGPEYDHTDGKGYYIYSETSSVGRGQSGY